MNTEIIREKIKDILRENYHRDWNGTFDRVSYELLQLIEQPMEVDIIEFAGSWDVWSSIKSGKEEHRFVIYTSIYKQESIDFCDKYKLKIKGKL